MLCTWLQIGEYQNWGDGSPEQAEDTSPVDVSLTKQCYSSHNAWDAPPALVHLVSRGEYLSRLKNEHLLLMRCSLSVQLLSAVIKHTHSLSNC